MNTNVAQLEDAAKQRGISKELDMMDVTDCTTASGDLTTISGYRFHVRPAGPDDAHALEDLFEHVARDDLKFRFLSAVHHVSPEQIAAMTGGDHIHRETILAIDPDEGLSVATAMLAADPGGDTAEIAISVRTGFKSKGISWCLLKYCAGVAQTLGITRLYSVEDRANWSAINLERDMGFSVKPCPGDATLVTVDGAVDDILRR